MSQLQAARHLHRLDPKLPAPEAVVRRWRDWEAGRSAPSEHYQGLLQKLTGLSPERLGRRTVVDTDQVEEVDMERRVLFSALAGLGLTASLPLAALEQIRGRLTRVVGVPDALADWQSAAAQYAVHNGEPLPQRLGNLLVDLADLSRLVNSGHPDRGDLLAIAAQLSGYVAQTVYDLGDPRAAFRWWSIARRTADQSGAAGVRAWLRAREGADLLTGPRLSQQALRLAEEAIALSGQQRPTAGLAEAWQLRARVLASGGDPLARAALDDLARVVDHLPDEVRGDDLSRVGYAEMRLHSTSAWVHFWLRDVPAARAANDRARSLYAPTLTGFHAESDLLEAGCLVIDGDITEGVAAALAVASTPDQALSLRQRAAGVIGLLPAPAHALPAAREVLALASA